MQLSVPDDTDFLSMFGAAPSPVGEDQTQLSIELEANESEKVLLTYDVIGGSIRFRWSQSGVSRVDLFREGAAQISVDSDGPYTWLTVDFDINHVKGQLRVQIHPNVYFEDRLLLK
jgi:hypothetical protein